MLSALAFITAVILVYLGMQYYIASWVTRNFQNLPVDPLTIRYFVLLVAVSFPLSIYLLRAHEGFFTRLYAQVSYVWIGISVIFILCACLGDAGWLAARLSGAAPHVRRWIAWGVLASAAGLSLWSFIEAALPPRITRLEIPMRALPRELDGFTMVQLSDLHVGATIPLSRLERIVSMVDGLEPDVVLFTGDFMDPGCDREKVIERAQGIRAVYGTVAVFGNHEFYYGGKKAARDYAEMGMRLLRGKVMELPDGIQLAGVDDIRTAGLTKDDVRKVLAQLDPEKPSVFMSHQPLDFDLAADMKVGLMLSGHTHGGQVFPFHIFVKLFHPYFRGLYKRGESYLYVTTGAGCWGPPMRLFARSEIVYIVLRSEE